jgi:hypothetical protein
MLDTIGGRGRVEATLSSRRIKEKPFCWKPSSQDCCNSFLKNIDW